MDTNRPAGTNAACSPSADDIVRADDHSPPRALHALGRRAFRLKDPAPLDEFFTDAVAAIEQAQKSPGNLGADALPDAGSAIQTIHGERISSPSKNRATSSRVRGHIAP
jgi:hypothetical protein